MRNNQRPTFVDLFCGAGGFSTGFRAAGFAPVLGVDVIDVFCRTHAMNFPDSKTACLDLSQATPHHLASLAGIKPGGIDVVVGSPPCQTFSSIGIPKIRSLKQDAILSDPRNYLFKSFISFIAFVKPKIFVMENVPAMKTRFGGKLFQNLLDMIVDAGYQPFHTVLNSCHFGVPQTRRRLIVVGVKPNLRFSFPTPTHSDGDTSSRQTVQPDLLLQCSQAVSVGDAIFDLPVIEDGCRIDELPYSKHHSLTDYQLRMRNKTGFVRNNICRMSNDRAKRVFRHMPQGAKYKDLPKAVRSILPFREDIFGDRLKRLNAAKPAWTILAHIGMDGYMYIHPTECRTLSVREAARLQSFPDDFLFAGNMREQYVQVGNAVPPLLAQACASAVKATIQ